jgi:DNA-binding IclR family transcriptional regulator
MSKNTIPAVEKTLQLIECIGKSNVPLSRTELAKQLGITPTTCYRILQTLLEYDWISREDANRFRLGGGLLPVLRTLHDVSSRYQKLQGTLDRLAKETKLSSKFSIRRGLNQVTILRGDPRTNVHVSGKVGGEFPIVEGSVGTVLLSQDSPEDIAEMMLKCQDNIPESTDSKLLMKRILFFRKNGYVVCDNNRWNVHAMSAAVYENEELTGALTLLGWEDDFHASREKNLSQTLIKYASECTEILMQQEK